METAALTPASKRSAAQQPGRVLGVESVNAEFVELLPVAAEPVVELLIDEEPLGGLVWFVPAVGLVFVERLELPLAPADELQGRPSRPVFPDMGELDGLLGPELLPLVDDPGVAEGLDPLLMLPAAVPALPPLAPPPVWANTRLAVPAIRVVANIVNIVSVFRMTSAPVPSLVPTTFGAEVSPAPQNSAVTNSWTTDASAYDGARVS